MKEPKRYIANAKELLGKSAIEGKLYADSKYVRSACGVAYLGVLEVINEQLQTKYGVARKDLPKKVEEYRKALQKHVSVHNGKLLKEFDALYDELHIAGYYRGLLHGTDVIKDVLKRTVDFIGKLEQ